jgi:hypothetical protein
MFAEKTIKIISGAAARYIPYILDDMVLENIKKAYVIK